MTIKYIGLLLSPKPLKIELIILYAVINGIPRKQIVRYLTAPSTASAGVETAFTIGFTTSTKAAVRTKESAIKSVTVLPIYCRFFAVARTHGVAYAYD